MISDVAITLPNFYQILDFLGTIRDNSDSIRTPRSVRVPDDCATTVSRES